MSENVDYRLRTLAQVQAQQDQAIASPKVDFDTLAPGGGGPHNPSMEARVAVLEQIAKDTKEMLGEMKQDIRDIKRDQKTDFRILFGATITTTLGLAYLMAHGFHWL